SITIRFPPISTLFPYTTLFRSNFRVFEDNSEQKVSILRQEDVPVSMGLLIDNSASMSDKREKVNAAALTFVKTSNPDDEVFVGIDRKSTRLNSSHRTISYAVFC